MVNFIIILVLCLGVLFIYFKTKSFKSLKSLLMFVIAFLALLLRLDNVSDFPLLGFLNKDTLFQSFLIIIPTALTFLFFISIHLSSKSSIKKYWFLLFVFTFINVWVYLIWNNILPQALMHGLVGAVLFTEFTDTDQLKTRLA